GERTVVASVRPVLQPGGRVGAAVQHRDSECATGSRARRPDGTRATGLLVLLEPLPREFAVLLVLAGVVSKSCFARVKVHRDEVAPLPDGRIEGRLDG